jgi:hypothetical protein
LKSHEKLTDEQINQYLYLEASEELIIKENKVENQVVSSSINMTKVLKFLAPMGFFSYFSLLLSFCIVELRRERLEFEKVKFTIRKSSQQNILLNF